MLWNSIRAACHNILDFLREFSPLEVCGDFDPACLAMSPVFSRNPDAIPMSLCRYALVIFRCEIQRISEIPAEFPL